MNGEVSELDQRAQTVGWKARVGWFATVSSPGWLVLAVITSLWRGLSLHPPLVVRVLDFATFAFGSGLFLLNLTLVVLAKGDRRRYLVFIALFVLANGFALWMSDWHVEKRHRWFIQHGMKPYVDWVQQIVENRTLLRSESQDLCKIMRLPRCASAYTNSDGSVTIWFAGRDGSPRHGYIYHSGDLLGSKPGNPQDYFVHLTNGWYEY